VTASRPMLASRDRAQITCNSEVMLHGRTRNEARLWRRLWETEATGVVFGQDSCRQQTPVKV
ncbi:MAG TPA: hypothetical protein VED66_14210, partial [Candidatus Sulfotelmatobacter sp.]|nr:hypothetical protein [Candidatus Sulfotelmatobacter sp.]